MSDASSAPTRRTVLAHSMALLAATAATGAFTLLPGNLASAAQSNAIRPFRINIPEDALVDLRRRLNATRWPGRETVSDTSQGVQQAKLQELVRYWQTGYDWRKGEAKLNALPQFVTTIDGLDIQFSSHSLPPSGRNALDHDPRLARLHLRTHQGRGAAHRSTAHGGRAEDAFHLVLPSLPGFGFSGKPQGTGWDSDHIARAWAELMARLGYTRYVSQGGDCGSVVSQRMARQGVKGLVGIHVNMPGTVPADIARLLTSGDPAPAGLSAKERAAFDSLDTFYKKSAGYSAVMVTRPQTVGYALADSPVGQAAWIYEKFAGWTYTDGNPERALTRDEMLDDISLYWLTNSATSSAQIYWEDHSNNFNAIELSMPVAVTVFPGEIYRAPRSWAERNYHQLVYWNEVDKGGHFAAWEEPELFSSEVSCGIPVNALRLQIASRTRSSCLIRADCDFALQPFANERVATPVLDGAC